MASKNSLDSDVSHQNSPLMLSQAVLGVGRCSRAVRPSSPLEAPNSLAQAAAAVHVQIMGDWQAADPPVSLVSGSPPPRGSKDIAQDMSKVLLAAKGPAREDKNRNDNVEPNGFTGNERLKKCCPQW